MDTNSSLKEQWIDKAQDIFNQLNSILEELETGPENRDYFLNMNKLLKDFSITCKPFSYFELERFCRLIRIISKYCLRVHDAAILNISVAIIYDAIDIMKKMHSNIKLNKTIFVCNANFKVLATRIRWLKGKLKDIEGQMAKIGDHDIDKEIPEDLESIETILSEFNL